MPKRTPVKKKPKAIIKIAFLVSANFPMKIYFIFFLVLSELTVTVSLMEN